MNSELLETANQEVIFNIFLYLSHRLSSPEGLTLKKACILLEKVLQTQLFPPWKSRDIRYLNLLKAATERTYIANTLICNLTYSENGLTACSFIKPDNSISIAFKGTGNGEWIDNGEGLSGIIEENSYSSYDEALTLSKSVKSDFASQQQVEALNWFNYTVSKNNWTAENNIIVSGHSKGGNKAQFIAINSDLPRICCSFDGHGFSPEAISSFKKQLGIKYYQRRKHIYSMSADNDYVNVLGIRLMSDSNIFFFKSISGFHYIDSIVDSSGALRPQCEQGKLSAYVQSVSDELMTFPSSLRQYATRGIMNIFQKYFGKGTPVNGDFVSTEDTFAGIGIAIASFLRQVKRHI